MVNIAVILSGCGYLDGAEIRESVLALLYLDEAGADVQVFAPDIMQSGVVNHLTGEAVAGESRNVLAEAARIARGQVKPLAELESDAFDALILPGGYGVAKNLSDVAEKGASASIHPEFRQAIHAFLEAKKPIGAICIAPAVLAVVAKNKGLTVTIGDDAGVADVITTTGNKHEACVTDAIIVDHQQHIASCSAYMREDRLADIAKGIRGVVQAVIEMCNQQKKAA